MGIVSLPDEKCFGDEDQPLSDGWWFWQQAAACTHEIPPEGTIHASLCWGVHPVHRTETAAGLQPVHDDRLISAALVAELNQLLREGKVALGVARSEVIPRGTRSPGVSTHPPSLRILCLKPRPAGCSRESQIGHLRLLRLLPQAPADH